MEEVSTLLKGKPFQEIYLVVQKTDDKIKSLNSSSTGLSSSFTSLNNHLRTPLIAQKFIADLSFGDTSMDGIVEVFEICLQVFIFLF